MKRAKVYRNGEWIAAAEFEDPTEWIEEGKSKRWWGDPSLLTFEVEDITEEYENRLVLEKRIAEYPTVEEFLNVFFDGGDEGMQQLIKKRQEIKAKYPKWSEK